LKYGDGSASLRTFPGPARRQLQTYHDASKENLTDAVSIRKTRMAESEYKFLGIGPKGWVLTLIGVFLVLPMVMVQLNKIPGFGDGLAAITDPIYQRGRTLLESESVVAIGTGFFKVLLAPGAWVVMLIWTKVLRQDSNPFLAGSAVTTVSMIVALVVCWIFWRTVWVRSLHFIGWWDPFPHTGAESRRWVLKSLVWLRDSYEMAVHFGRRATGNWASLLEVLSNRWYPGDVFLGRPRFAIGGMMRPIGLKTEKHMITIAGTGSGKSTAALVPNLCIHEGSLLCIDPKGELARITAGRRGRGGNGVEGLFQAVHVLDPFNVSGLGSHSGYNVFDELAAVAEHDVDRPVSYAGKIAEALVKPLSLKDPYWDNAAQTFLRGLILYVFVYEPEENRNLPRMRELIVDGDVAGHRAAVKKGTIKPDDVTPFDTLLEKMKTARDGPIGAVIAASAAAIDLMGHNQRGAVLSTVQEHTSFLDTPEIARVSTRSDFLLEDLKHREASIFLCLPVNMVAGKEGSWLRMFVLLFIDMMMRVQKGGPQQPILLAIDEFPSLGRLDGIEVVAPVLRSYGARFWAIGQDIEQFRKAYPDSWGGFIGGAEAVQFMGIKHAETVDFIGKLLGRHVVMQMQGQGSRAVRTMTERALLDQDQVRRMLSPDRATQIIWRGNARPMLLKTAPYFEYMPAKYYDADPRFKEKLRRRVWRPFKKKSVHDLPPHKPPQPPPGNGAPAPPAAPPQFDADMFKRFRNAQSNLKETGEILPWASVLEEARKGANAPRPRTPEVKRQSALEDLHAMIGLAGVKEQVEKLIALMKHQKDRKKHGKKESVVFSHHLVFTGNPGTGKTTVARIVGRIYKELGVLKSGHVVEVDRSGLVAGFVGHTAPQVQKVVESALDGVLFIDEAYTLSATKSENDFGPEAIAALLKAMEDNRHRLAVIVAGYTKEMQGFIAANPGLRSRFNTTIHFDDYDAEDLARIFEKCASDGDYRLSMDATVALRDHMKWVKANAGTDFGNGRDVRNMFQECIIRQAGRLADKKNVTESDVTMIEVQDLPESPPLRILASSPGSDGTYGFFSKQDFKALPDSEFERLVSLYGLEEQARKIAGGANSPETK
jgi:type IV secretory pathway TraG/TraD family ATPase VirD4/AAA+ superfamily predicted ATPase